MGNILNLPIKNNTIDFIILTEVIEHIYAPDIAIEECYRVLKKGSKILFTIPFMYGIHLENDYFRLTEYGIKKLCEKYNLERGCNLRRRTNLDVQLPSASQYPYGLAPYPMPGECHISRLYLAISGTILHHPNLPQYHS